MFNSFALKILSWTQTLTVFIVFIYSSGKASSTWSMSSLTRNKTPPPPMTRSLRKDLNPFGKTLQDGISGPNLDS